MALRDKLRQRLQPLLGPGEQIQEVFLARSLPRGAVTPATSVLGASFWIVAVTDRSVVVFSVRSKMQIAQPKEVAVRLPRETRLGPITRRDFAELNVSVDGRPILVRRPFFKDVRRADDRLDGPDS